MTELPRVSAGSTTADLAMTYSQELFESRGWKFRRQTDQNDFGIDAEVEMVELRTVTGRFFKCQVKGLETIKWRDSRYGVSVKRSTFQYWLAVRLPVVVLLVDVSGRQIFWAVPYTETCAANANYATIRMVLDNQLPETFSELEAFINTWMDAFSLQSVFDEFPYFHGKYQELKAAIDVGDPWVQIGERTALQVRLLYAYITRLRLSVGLGVHGIIPLDHWYFRNDEIWRDFELFHATFSELMEYMGTYFEEAAAIMIDRVGNLPWNSANAYVKNYVENLNHNTTVEVRTIYLPEMDSRPAFHKQMEQEIKTRAGLRTSWFSQKDKPNPTLR